MRTFIAIILPDEIKERLSELQAKLKKTEAEVSWVKPHNIHLTLKFLGEVDEKLLHAIGASLDRIVKSHKRVDLRIAEIGAFPSLNRPRVIWAGIDKGDNEVKTLAQEIESEMSRLGLTPEEKEFSSHITIGRVRSGLNNTALVLELPKINEFIRQENLEFSAERINLYKSTLTPQGPIYEALKEVSLNTA